MNASRLGPHTPPDMLAYLATIQSINYPRPDRFHRRNPVSRAPAGVLGDRVLGIPARIWEFFYAGRQARSLSGGNTLHS